MFVGHLALALAAKRSVPRVNLGWLVAGVMALDLVWPILVLAGAERVSIVAGATAFNPLVFDSYPWSHSLVMAVVWGLVLAGFSRRFGNPAAPAGLLVALVVSHWVLDVVTHVPDLPLWPGASPRVGLGLWNSIAGTLLIEGALWVGGLALYLRGRKFRGAGARLAFWSLIGVATVTWGMSPWSPPPPGPTALGLFALISWLLIPWAGAADRGSSAEA